MEREGSSSPGGKGQNNESENLNSSPRCSKRLKNKAKAMNKSRISLEDLLCTVDKRNEKLGFIVTNIRPQKSDKPHSKNLVLPNCDQNQKRNKLTNVPFIFKEKCGTSLATSVARRKRHKSVSHVFSEKEDPCIATQTSRKSVSHVYLEKEDPCLERIIQDRTDVDLHEKSLDSIPRRMRQRSRSFDSKGFINVPNREEHLGKKTIQYSKHCANLNKVMNKNMNSDSAANLDKTESSLLSKISPENDKIIQTDDKTTEKMENFSQGSSDSEVTENSPKELESHELLIPSVFSLETTNEEDNCIVSSAVSQETNKSPKKSAEVKIQTNSFQVTTLQSPKEELTKKIPSPEVISSLGKTSDVPDEGEDSMCSSSSSVEPELKISDDQSKENTLEYPSGVSDEAKEVTFSSESKSVPQNLRVSQKSSDLDEVSHLGEVSSVNIEGRQYVSSQTHVMHMINTSDNVPKVGVDVKEETNSLQATTVQSLKEEPTKKTPSPEVISSLGKTSNVLDEGEDSMFSPSSSVEPELKISDDQSKENTLEYPSGVSDEAKEVTFSSESKSVPQNLRVSQKSSDLDEVSHLGEVSSVNIEGRQYVSSQTHVMHMINTSDNVPKVGVDVKEETNSLQATTVQSLKEEPTKKTPSPEVISSLGKTSNVLDEGEDSMFSPSSSVEPELKISDDQSKKNTLEYPSGVSDKAKEVTFSSESKSVPQNLRVSQKSSDLDEVSHLGEVSSVNIEGRQYVSSQTHVMHMINTSDNVPKVGVDVKEQTNSLQATTVQSLKEEPTKKTPSPEVISSLGKTSNVLDEGEDSMFSPSSSVEPELKISDDQSKKNTLEYPSGVSDEAKEVTISSESKSDPQNLRVSQKSSDLDEVSHLGEVSSVNIEGRQYVSSQTHVMHMINTSDNVPKVGVDIKEQTNSLQATTVQSLKEEPTRKTPSPEVISSLGKTSNVLDEGEDSIFSPISSVEPELKISDDQSNENTLEYPSGVSDEAKEVTISSESKSDPQNLRVSQKSSDLDEVSHLGEVSSVNIEGRQYVSSQTHVMHMINTSDNVPKVGVDIKEQTNSLQATTVQSLKEEPTRKTPSPEVISSLGKTSNVLDEGEDSIFSPISSVEPELKISDDQSNENTLEYPSGVSDEAKEVTISSESKSDPQNLSVSQKSSDLDEVSHLGEVSSVNNEGMQYDSSQTHAMHMKKTSDNVPKVGVDIKEQTNSLQATTVKSPKEEPTKKTPKENSSLEKASDGADEEEDRIFSPSSSVEQVVTILDDHNKEDQWIARRKHSKSESHVFSEKEDPCIGRLTHSKSVSQVFLEKEDPCIERILQGRACVRLNEKSLDSLPRHISQRSRSFYNKGFFNASNREEHLGKKRIHCSENCINLNEVMNKNMNSDSAANLDNNESSLLSKIFADNDEVIQTDDKTTEKMENSPQGSSEIKVTKNSPKELESHELLIPSVFSLETTNKEDNCIVSSVVIPEIDKSPKKSTEVKKETNSLQLTTLQSPKTKKTPSKVISSLGKTSDVPDQGEDRIFSAISSVDLVLKIKDDHSKENTLQYPSGVSDESREVTISSESTSVPQCLRVSQKNSDLDDVSHLGEVSSVNNEGMQCDSSQTYVKHLKKTSDNVPKVGVEVKKQSNSLQATTAQSPKEESIKKIPKEVSNLGKALDVADEGGYRIFSPSSSVEPVLKASDDNSKNNTLECLPGFSNEAKEVTISSERTSVRQSLRVSQKNSDLEEVIYLGEVSSVNNEGKQYLSYQTHVKHRKTTSNIVSMAGVKVKKQTDSLQTTTLQSPKKASTKKTPPKEVSSLRKASDVADEGEDIIFSQSSSVETLVKRSDDHSKKNTLEYLSGVSDVARGVTIRSEITSVPQTLSESQKNSDLDEVICLGDESVIIGKEKHSFFGYKTDRPICLSRGEPVVVLKKLPSWVNEYQTLKVLVEPSPLKELQLSKSVTNDEEFKEKILQIGGRLETKRKQHKSVNDISELIHNDLQEEKECMMPRRRITRSLGEEIKINYTAKLPDERDAKVRKIENEESVPFYGFNIPFGFLGLPDHYLVYKSILKNCEQEGLQIDKNLGAGNLDENSKFVYFSGESNPFKSKVLIYHDERDKISPTKILDIASTHRKKFNDSLRPYKASCHSHNTSTVISHEKMQSKKNSLARLKRVPSKSSSKPSNRIIPSYFTCDQSSRSMDPIFQDSVCASNLNDAFLVRNTSNEKQTGKVGYSCGKDFCRLGCICESLKVKNRVKEHCGHEECMFSSSCCKKLNAPKSSHDQAKLSILKNLNISSCEEDLIRSKRKRKAPLRFLEEHMIYDNLSMSSKKYCYESNFVSKGEDMNSEKIIDCHVLLNKFNLPGANVRCLFHLRLNCPCLTGILERPSRNVAMKSTSQRLQLNPSPVIEIPQKRHSIPSKDQMNAVRTPFNVSLKSTSQRLGMNQHCLTLLFPQSAPRTNLSKLLPRGELDSKYPTVMKDFPKDNSSRYFFNNMEEFQNTLSLGTMKCSQLEEMCSKSLAYLPKYAVQIMKMPILKKLLREEQAFLWIMHLPQSRAHVFVTKECKAPSVACLRVRDLEDTSTLPSYVSSIFSSSGNANRHLIISILISHVYFWQANGTISFVSSSGSQSAKTEFPFVTSISNSNPTWYANTLKKSPTKKLINLSVVSNGESKTAVLACNLDKFNSTSSFLVNGSQLSDVATKSRTSTSSVSPKEENSNDNLQYIVWYYLDPNKKFDELRVMGTTFRVTYSKLKLILAMAQSKKSILRLLFNHKKDGKPGPGILVHPKDTKFPFRIGPYRINQETGVKTYRYVNGILTETPSFLTLSKILAQGTMVQPLFNYSKTQSKIVKSTPIFSNLNESMQVNCSNSSVSNANEFKQLNKPDPNLSDIVSTEDADPGFTIKIQSVQGNWAGFNDIPSPKKRDNPSRVDHDVEEMLPNAENAFVNKINHNLTEINILNNVLSDTVDAFANDSYRDLSEITTSIKTISDSEESVVKDSYYNSTESKMSNEIVSDTGGTFVKDSYYDFSESKTSIKTISDSEESVVKDSYYNSTEFKISNEIVSDTGGAFVRDSYYDFSESKTFNKILSVTGKAVARDSYHNWPEAEVSDEIPLDDTEVSKPNERNNSIQKNIIAEKKKSMLNVCKRSGVLKSILKKGNSSKTTGKKKALPAAAKLFNRYKNIVSGYLVPDVPGIQPIPVARGGMTEYEMNAITLKNPMKKDGKTMHFLDLGLANLFLNRAILGVVNYFPSNLKINFIFVKVDGMGSSENFDGMVNLGDLTNNMFITSKGVFSYDEVTRCGFQRCGIDMTSLHRFMETKRRRHIINVRQELLDCLPVAKKGNTMIATIRYAHQEIKKLEAECAELESQIYSERCIKSSLMSTLRQLASTAERKDMMESLELIKSLAPLGNEEDVAQSISLKKGSSTNKKLRAVKRGRISNKKKTLSVISKPKMKQNTKTQSLRNHFNEQFTMLKNLIISSKRLKYKGSVSGGYSILKSTESVLAAAAASSNDNDDSILSSGSDLDVGNYDDFFTANHEDKDKETAEKERMTTVKEEVISVLDVKDGAPCFLKAQQSVVKTDDLNVAFSSESTNNKTYSSIQDTEIPSLTISSNSSLDITTS